MQNHFLPAEGNKKALSASLWFQFLVAIAIVCLGILIKGYKCFRADHLTQIPLYFIQNDSTLFRNDWFLTSFGHFKERHYPLLILHAGHFMFQNLPAGIFFFYFVFVGATVWAWLKISDRLFQSLAPGVIVALLAIFYYDSEIGSNHVLEDVLIPRSEAFPFAFWGIYLLLTGRYVLAGALVALGAYFQLAVGLFFGVPMVLWLFLRRDKKCALGAVKFLIAFLAILIPECIRWLVGAGMLEKATVSASEEIQLAAYIRHPHHMVPHLWGNKWYEFAALLTISGISWSKMRGKFKDAWTFGYLALVIMGILAASTVFIEIIPVKSIVELQPYRLAVLLCFVLYLIAAPHIIKLLCADSLVQNWRGFAIIVAGPEWRLVVCLAILELAIFLSENKGRILSDGHQLTMVIAAMTAAIIWDGDLWRYPIAIALMAWINIFLRAKGSVFSPSTRIRSLAAANALSLLFFLSFFILPYREWMEHGSEKTKMKIADLTWKFQVNPLPIKEIERVGDWARTNTPKDSVFLIPPQRTSEGFGIWSQRAAVFCIKFFPYNPKGLEQWKERYLAVRGISDPNSREARAKLADAMNDFGAEEISHDYKTLTPAQVLSISKKYKADYIITPADYPAPAFEKVYEDHDVTRRRRITKLYHLYKIRQ